MSRHVICHDYRGIPSCLYKPTSGIQWTPEQSWTSDRPQKQASAKADLLTFGSGALAIS